MATSNDPQPGEFWATAKGRTAEILARQEVTQEAAWEERIDTVAYRFLGGSMVHLRSVSSLEGWKKVGFE